MSDTKMDFAQFQHDYVFKNLQAADQKASVVLAISSGLLGYMSTNKEYVGWLREGLHTWQTWIAFFALLGFIYSVWMSIRVIWPNLTGSPKGLIFWQAVASLAAANDYFNKVNSTTDDQLLREVLEHNYEVSFICATKFRRMRHAMYAGLAGALLLFADFAIVTNHQAVPARAVCCDQNDGAL